jgi:lipopolysaccharide transport system permease protein
MKSLSRAKSPEPAPAEPTVNETLVIQPSRGWARLHLSEVWRFRELLFFLVWRDIKVRYKQTALGASWAILQPFMLMVVFSVFLGHLAKVPSNGVPYPIFSYAALVPWTLFSSSLAGASGSIVRNVNLVSKVYFPRLILPLAAGASFILDFAIALVLVVGMMFYYGVYPSLAVLWLPALTLLALITALAVGIWSSAVNVRYRDVQYAVPFLIQLWLFASPVAYPSTLIPKAWRPIYGLNPIAGVVEGFRWALLGTNTRPGPMIAVSAGAAIVMLVGGMAYFQRLERTFADLI